MLLSGNAESKSTALAGLADDQNVAAVLAEHLAADGQAQARAARSLVAHKWLEDLFQSFRRDARAIVGHGAARPFTALVQERGNRDARLFLSLDRVQGVGHDVEKRPMNSLGVHGNERQSLPQPDFDRDP